MIENIFYGLINAATIKVLLRRTLVHSVFLIAIVQQASQLMKSKKE